MTAHSVSIGHRIKERRQEVGLTLRELGKRAGVSASFLSQVERGKVNTSLRTLRRIAEALDVSVLHFLSETRQHSPVVRASARPRLTVPQAGVTYELMVPSLSRKMEVFQGRVAPGTGNFARPLREPTEECIVVLSGALLVGLESGEYVLYPGDSIYFEGVSLRKLACASDEEAVWISVITPPVF